MNAIQEAPPSAGVGDLVNRLAQELAQMQRTLAESQRKLASCTRSLELRTQELGEARNRIALLQFTLDCMPDGLLAAPRFGQTLHVNARFAEIWGLAPHQLQPLDPAVLAALQLTRVRDPESFHAQAERHRAHPDEEHTSRVELADGRVLEWKVTPRMHRGRRIGTVTAWREIS